MFGSIAARIENSSAIVVAKAVGRTGLGYGAKNVKHFRQSLIEAGGNLHAVPRRQQSRMQKKVQRVHVIVERLLEIYSVGTHLTVRLLQHDAPAFRTPAFG